MNGAEFRAGLECCEWSGQKNGGTAWVPPACCATWQDGSLCEPEPPEFPQSKEGRAGLATGFPAASQPSKPPAIEAICR